TATAVIPQGSVRAAVYDLLGRSVYKQTVLFNNGSASINVNTVPGMYILELADEDGNAGRQRIVIE
ncbi:MAG TPA: T9SS type A sorting domain-containing protein, partial [Chitinophagaceae bacterium]|nr:T9SS type A sorting domain-containing protein [Chitinophagaceae bacterium]